VLRRGSYFADDLYKWKGEYGFFNVAGVLSWLAGIMVAIAIHPVGPPQVTALLDGMLGEGVPGLPVLMIGVLSGGLLYMVLGWIVLRRRAGTYRLRGM
jgi:hypothetical protein